MVKYVKIQIIIVQKLGHLTDNILLNFGLVFGLLGAMIFLGPQICSVNVGLWAVDGHGRLIFDVLRVKVSLLES